MKFPRKTDGSLDFTKFQSMSFDDRKLATADLEKNGEREEQLAFNLYLTQRKLERHQGLQERQEQRNDDLQQRTIQRNDGLQQRTEERNEGLQQRKDQRAKDLQITLASLDKEKKALIIERDKLKQKIKDQVIASLSNLSISSTSKPNSAAKNKLLST